MAHRNRADQQATEKLHIEDFLRRTGVTSSVEYADVPDAVLLVEGRRIGLEHCELRGLEEITLPIWAGGWLGRSIALRKLISSCLLTEQDLAANSQNISALEIELQDELAKLGLGHDFSVGVGLRAEAPLFRKRSQVNTLAKHFARLAFDQASALSVGATGGLNAPALARHGFADLLCLTITRFPYENPRGLPDVFVQPGFAGPGVSSARSAIRAKERRLPAYKVAKALDEVWLLLVTGESWVQATTSMMTEWHQFPSKFDAVYLLDLRTDQLQRMDKRAEK